MNRNRLVSLVAAGWLAGGVIAAAAFQSAPANQPPRRGYKPFSDPARLFSLYHPDNWKVIPGVRDVIATLAESDVKGVVVIERLVLPEAVPETLDESFIKVVLSELRSRQPDVLNVQTSFSAGRPKTWIVNYTRTGINGPERLRQYTFADGTLFLRLICIALEKEFERQRPTFETIATSVRISSTKVGQTIERD